MATAQATTDHDEIRRWVEARGGHPARVKSTGKRNDPGILRIDFPGFSGEDSLEEIEWEEFFEWFDRNNLAMLLSEARGNRFNKLVDRGNVKSSPSKKKSSGTRKASSTKKTSAARKSSSAKKAVPAKKASSTKKASSSKKASPSSKKASASRSSSTKAAKTSKKTTTKKSSSKKPGKITSAAALVARAVRNALGMTGSTSKTSSKKASSKKVTSKKAPSKKATSTNTSSKKASSKKASSKKASSKKAPSKKASSTKTSSKKSSRQTSGSSVTTTNHDEIRNWVEARGGYPATVAGTEGRGEEAGLLRIDYPGYSGAGTLERIDWDAWFEKFDEEKLAFLYQDKRNSRFSKLVRR